MFTIDNTLLVLIDIQGKLASLMHDRETLYKNLEILVKSIKAFDIPIIWMEQVPENLGPTILEISENLPDLKPVSKYTFSCCGNDRFMEKLKESRRNQILLSGIETHICVYQTALDLISKGYEVEVLSDCVASRTDSNRNLGLTRMNQAGALLTSVEMILFELMKSTKAPKFKDITKLIK